MKLVHKKILSSMLALLLISGCAGTGSSAASSPSAAATLNPSMESPEESAEQKQPESNDVVILYTSDMHCGMMQGFGAVGLMQIRNTLEKNGIKTLLVDNGDAIQGDVIGTLTKGEAITELMNDLHYDVAIPGNHEFDYGMEQFMKITELAEFPYISCNFRKEGELIFEPYIIKEAGGWKIAFVGVTTPMTLSSSNPRSFQDDDGNYIYDFTNDEDGTALIEAIHKSVDAARSEGADYVVLLSHIGNKENMAPYNFQTIIERTAGIDVLLDGHTHDLDQVTLNNKDGKPVIRSACGTKLQAVGYMYIEGDDGKVKCGILSWNNEIALPDILGIENEISEPEAEIYRDLDKVLNRVVAHSDVELTINDPEKTNADGSPRRVVRLQETNLGDLAADAVRDQLETDVGLMNGGGIRDSIAAGDITYGDIIRVMPFTNMVSVSKITGQQLLDMLEWGVRYLPDDSGAFMQVSGLTYEVHAYLPSHCVVDTNGGFGGVDGEYRVKNVKVGGEPLDLKKSYTVGSSDFILKHHGSGFTMLGEEDILHGEVMSDNQMLINYIVDELDGRVGEEYRNPHGNGRISVYYEKPQ